jgi:hypothetical protein
MTHFISSMAVDGHNAKAFMQRFWIERNGWEKKAEGCAFSDPVVRAFQYCRMIGLLANGNGMQQKMAYSLNEEARQKHVWTASVSPEKCRSYQKLAEKYLGGISSDDVDSDDELDRIDHIALDYYGRVSKDCVVVTC